MPVTFYSPLMTYRTVMLHPGSVPAGTLIPLPDYAKGAKAINLAVKVKTTGGGGSHSHGYGTLAGPVPSGGTTVTSTSAQPTITMTSGATGAYALAEADLPAHLHSVKLTVVTTTPASGQIQLYDQNNIKLGDAIANNEILYLTLEFYVHE